MLSDCDRKNFHAAPFEMHLNIVRRVVLLIVLNISASLSNIEFIIITHYSFAVVDDAGLLVPLKTIEKSIYW